MDRPAKLCSQFEEHLPDLLGLEAGEPAPLPSRLSAEERARFLEHGRQCARCAEVLRTYGTTVQLLRALPRNPAPADFLAWIDAAWEKARSP